MAKRQKKVIVGARNSKLSKIQTNFAIAKLAEIFPHLKFKIRFFSSPGDRDKNLDLRSSPPDFFTRDLDLAIENREISCAIHSAKDLPEKLRENIDFFWLPWGEDPRDVFVLPKTKIPSLDEKSIGKPETESEIICKFTPNINIQGSKFTRIGVCSVRREEFCKKYFPDAKLVPIRGNVEERIAKLDKGDFDMIICAAAGLKRLGLGHRISQYIPLGELQVPDGQGRLAITFKKGNHLFSNIRKFLIYPVIFAGAGPGDTKLLTQAALDELRNCDICIHDALVSPEILRHLKPGAKAIHAGKRVGSHSIEQNEINIMIANFARQGMAVVRLKGGDPGIFGRLSEETSTLEYLDIPFRVIPGISSLQTATTSTGMFLTRRGMSRAFMAFTPRKAVTGDCEVLSRNELLTIPTAVFMATSELAKLSEHLLSIGRKPDEPVAIVFNSGCSNERIFHTKISDMGKLSRKTSSIGEPGIVLCGENFDRRFLFRHNGLLEGRKILLTCSEDIGEKATREALRLGGIPISMPMISFEPSSESGELFSGLAPLILRYDWIAITSPASARIFLNATAKAKFDIRRLPKIMSSGPETSKELLLRGIIPDIEAERDFGSKGLAEIARKTLKKGDAVLRLVSDKSLKKMTTELRRSGISVHEFTLYKTVQKKYEVLPDFDAVFFASPSAVESFKNSFGTAALSRKDIIALGDVTADAVKKIFKKRGRLTIPEQSLANLAISNYALQFL